MAKYRKKPVVIEAMQFTERMCTTIATWCGHHALLSHDPQVDGYVLTIFTLEGNMKAIIGDWVIKGVNGEFYPCKPDIFEKTYEKVEDE